MRPSPSALPGRRRHPRRVQRGAFLLAGLLASLSALGVDPGGPALARAGSRRAAEGGTELAGRVEATLALHVEGGAIRDWLATLPAGSLERDAADWILAWLPLADCVALDLPLLQEHVLLAARSYGEAPWREALPRELWLRFIVPHRVSQEPAQPWRSAIRRELWPRVRGMKSMEDAALEVNRWCREQATFRSTSGRDQGPLTTMARGIGRCEEEMILTICALRAVGIPARSCATPYWTFTDNNHAWVEAWADGRWYYLGGCEPGQCLNDAWFTNAARRAGFVRSVGYGEFTPAGEPLYRAEQGSTLINSTRVYTDPFTLVAETEDGGEIWINVLNFGSLRPLGRVASGEPIELGPGGYALTAGPADALLLEVVQGSPGERVRASLDDADRYDFTASPGFWLRYPEGEQGPRRELDLVDEATEGLMQLRVNANEAARAKLRQPSAAERDTLAALPASQRERLEAALEQPQRSVSDLFALLEHYQGTAEREAFLDFVAMADDKDLLELDTAGIRTHVDGALAVRDRLAAVGLAVPDSVFVAGVLACRIEREPGGSWRSGLPLLPLAKDAESTLTLVLDAFRERMVEVEAGLFGPPLDPAQAWRLGRGSERDLGIALTGLLRANGFAARYRHGRCEVWLGEWRRLDPVAAAFHAGEAEGGGVGELTIGITRGGLPYAAESYRDFNICRPLAGRLESPWWDPALGAQDWDAGDYVLCAVARVPGGNAHGRLRAFTVRAGERTSVSLPLDVDAAGWDPAAALVTDAAAARAPALAKARSLSPTPRTIPARALLFRFDPGEPAARMLEALARARARLADLDLAFVPILAGGGDPAPWRERLREAGWSDALWLAADDRKEEAPLLVLRDGDELLLAREGFDAAADVSVHLALDVYSKSFAADGLDRKGSAHERR